MEFWGIEIKPGSPLKAEPEDGYIIHVSQVSLGESKKVKDENVPVYVKVGDDNQKLVIGNLSQKIPQVSLDLMFEQEFEISHECKSTSVFLLGYKTPDLVDEQDEELDSDFDSDEEGIPMDFPGSNANGLNDEKAKVEAGESDSDQEDESDSDEMGSDESDEEEEEEDKAPLKVEPPSKKRPNGGAMNNNTVASKKAKVAIQQKPSGGKKMGKIGKSGCQFPCGSSCKN